MFAYIHSPSQIPFFSSFPVESGLDTLLPCNRRFLSRCRLSRQHHMVRSIGTATGRRSFPLHTQATTADSRQLPIVCARRSSLIGLNCSRQLNQRAAAASTCLRTGTSTSTVERTEIQLLGTAACAGVKDAGVPLTASDRVAGEVCTPDSQGRTAGARWNRGGDLCAAPAFSRRRNRDQGMDGRASKERTCQGEGPNGRVHRGGYPANIRFRVWCTLTSDAAWDRRNTSSTQLSPAQDWTLPSSRCRLRH